MSNAAPITSDERRMLHAVPHRHTHRGPFEPGPLPDGLLARLQDDVTSEGAALVVIEAGSGYQKLASILAAWSRGQDLYPTSRAGLQSRAEAERWTREAQLGLARTTHPTARRPAAELTR